MDIPKEVLDSAKLIDNFFQSQSSHSNPKWQLLNICSRNYAYELESANKTIEELKDDIFNLEKDLYKY